MRATVSSGDPKRFRGGRVLFGPDSLKEGETAVDSTLPVGGTLVVPRVEANAPLIFRMAGESGRHSFNDKDVLVEAVDSQGRPFGTHRLMVRVRRNAHNMHSFEVQRFLEALILSKEGFNAAPLDSFDWPKGLSTFYENFADDHYKPSATGTHDDEAHSSGVDQPAFLPWHRAFILHFERKLQQIEGPPWDRGRYRSVTLSYWDWDAPSDRIFTDWFIGAPGGGGAIDDVDFDAKNPLFLWGTVPAQGGGNSNVQRSTGPIPGGTPSAPLAWWTSGHLNGLASFGPYAAAASFCRQQEDASHNVAHGWQCGAGQIASFFSAYDPRFYLLHSQTDRQWADWQKRRSRFGPIAIGDNSHYDMSVGVVYDATKPSILQKGSHRDYTMYPWDGSNGGAGLAERPANQGFLKTGFPESLNGDYDNLWPASTRAPKPGEMLDYQGRLHEKAKNRFGYCYEDVPY